MSSRLNDYRKFINTAEKNIFFRSWYKSLNSCFFTLAFILTLTFFASVYCIQNSEFDHVFFLVHPAILISVSVLTIIYYSPIEELKNNSEEIGIRNKIKDYKRKEIFYKEFKKELKNKLNKLSDKEFRVAFSEQSLSEHKEIRYILKMTIQDVLLSRNVEGMSLLSQYNTNVKIDNAELSEEELLFLIKKKSELIEEIDIENN